MGVLDTVNPEVVDDPKFLQRSVLLIGVSSETTPRDLIMRRFGRDVDAAVIVRDSETSQRVGLVVFAKAEDAVVHKKWKPDPMLYRRCIPVSVSALHLGALIFILLWISFAAILQFPWLLSIFLPALIPYSFMGAFQANSVRNAQQAVLEGSEDSERRNGTAATMRSLIPPQYLQNDDSTDFHLRCLLLRGSRLVDLSQGPYNLCRVAEDNQLASGTVCAAVVSEVLNAAILVYDDPQSTDKACRSASCLRAGSLSLYDTSLFPMPAGEVTGVFSQVPERSMLPEFFTKPEYLGRVVSVRGIPPKICDVRELAYYFTGFKLEALFVHRAQRKVFAVFGSQSDVRAARSRKPKAWGKLCRWRIWFEDLDDAYFQPVPAPAVDQEVAAQPYPGVPEEAIEMAKGAHMRSISHCSSGDRKGISEGLIRLAAVSRPDILLHKYFSDRAVILRGIDAGANEFYLHLELGITFGEIDFLVVHEEQGVAMVVFKSWKAPAKLRQQPAVTLRRFGVGSCEPIPKDVVVATLVSGTYDLVHSFGETYGRVVSYVDSLSASLGTFSGG